MLWGPCRGSFRLLTPPIDRFGKKVASWIYFDVRRFRALPRWGAGCLCGRGERRSSAARMVSAASDIGTFACRWLTWVQPRARAPVGALGAVSVALPLHHRPGGDGCGARHRVPGHCRPPGEEGWPQCRNPAPINLQNCVTRIWTRNFRSRQGSSEPVNDKSINN